MIREYQRRSDHKERLPEIKIINRSLLISHVDVEGEEIDGCQSLTTKDLKESRKPIPIEVGMR